MEATYSLRPQNHIIFAPTYYQAVLLGEYAWQVGDVELGYVRIACPPKAR